jgi:hypothetical protein
MKNFLFFFLCIYSALIQGQSIQTIYPNGGEIFGPGLMYNISWNSIGVTTVKIELSLNSGSSWINIKDSVNNTGSYDWVIPSAIVSDSCRIKISDRSNPTIYDISDNNFRIVPAGYDIIFPDGGEVLLDSSLQTIRWNYYNNSMINKLEYSTSGGNTWITIQEMLPGNVTSYDWIVPAAISDNCLIRISDYINPSVKGVSDSAFSIISRGVTIISPNGGEIYKAGTSQVITWTTNYEAQVKISLFTGSWWMVNSGSIPASQGSFEWTVPFYASSNSCRIRISDVNNPGLYDESDNPFTINIFPIDGDLSYPQYYSLASKQNQNSGFGNSIDVSRIYVRQDRVNQKLYLGLKCRLNTASSDGIGLFLDFTDIQGLPAGSSLGGDPGGHYMGNTGNSDFKADFETDYMFAINPGGGNSSVYFDAVSFRNGRNAQYIGSCDQIGNSTHGSFRKRDVPCEQHRICF